MTDKLPTKAEKHPNLKGGSRLGKPNKNTQLIREMVATALNTVGGADYLARVAESHPGPFMGLLGKVMPVQIEGEGGGAVQHSIKVTFG